MIIDHLAESHIFSQLGIEDLETIAKFAEFKRLDDNYLLIKEGSEDDFSIYILVSGALEIVSSRDENISSEVVISHQEKDLFGEIAWVTREKRIASVRTHGAAEIIRINGEWLDSFIDDNPKVGCKILRNVSMALCQRIKGNNTLIKQILWNY